MMQQPIEWHEECVRNMRTSLIARQQTLQRAMDDCRRLDLDIRTREAQIAQARAQGKTGFDAERFGTPVSPTTRVRGKLAEIDASMARAKKLGDRTDGLLTRNDALISKNEGLIQPMRVKGSLG